MFSDNEPSQSSAHLSFSVINVKEDAADGSYYSYTKKISSEK